MSAKPRNHFHEEQAAAYDKRFEKLASLKDALHLCMRAVLADAPEDARVLCVGAGTGAELLYLADAFPRWTFTLVEPATAMMARCRKHAEDAGIAERCTFHEGYADSLPTTGAFDVATSILVSQFILDPDARRDYFRAIAERLRPGGQLITADLATHESDGAVIPRGPLFEHWMALMRYNDMDDAALENYRKAVTANVGIRPATDTASLIASAGFTAPECICQTLLMHTWHARRVETSS